MKTIKRYYPLVFVFLLLLASCQTYKQNLNDNEAPFCEIGIVVDQKTLPTSQKEWGRTERYVQLNYIKNNRGREYEFYVSANDKGGLEEIEIEVCPKDALVPGSLKELKKTFDPSKTGSYLVSGKIRPLKKGEKVSIRAVVKGKDARGSKTHTTSMYAFASDLRYQNGGRPLENLCQPKNSQNQTTIIFERPGHTNSGSVNYCACVHDNNLTNSACPRLANHCKRQGKRISKNTRGLYIINNNSSYKIDKLIDPNGKEYLHIPKNGRIPYSGPIYGEWSLWITSGNGQPLTLDPSTSITIGY